jgi:tetratricopeptide (TPR) repeat protein
VARRIRTAGRKRVAAAALLALLATAVQSRAQPSPSYRSLAATYARGGADAEAATLELATMPQAKVTASIAADARGLPTDLQRAAVMLHTDTAYAQLLMRLTANALFQIGTARRVFAEMKRGGRGDARTQAFERRWFAFVTSMLTSNSLIDRAELILRDALTLYPREARLHVAGGALAEMRVAMTPFDPKSGNQIIRRDRGLEAAAAAYRRAIEDDPMLTIAHLRLGWVHVTLHDGRAREDLDRALAIAADPVDRYLAHLLLGGIAERESRFDDARREYEAAQTIGPTCQTPYIALARTETALGHASRAGEISRSFAAIVEKANDPWWDFHLGGFDDPSLRWLRSEATTP